MQCSQSVRERERKIDIKKSSIKFRILFHYSCGSIEIIYGNFHLAYTRMFSLSICYVLYHLSSNLKCCPFDRCLFCFSHTQTYFDFFLLFEDAVFTLSETITNEKQSHAGSFVTLSVRQQVRKICIYIYVCVYMGDIILQ